MWSYLHAKEISTLGITRVSLGTNMSKGCVGCFLYLETVFCYSRALQSSIFTSGERFPGDFLPLPRSGEEHQEPPQIFEEPANNFSVSLAKTDPARRSSHLRAWERGGGLRGERGHSCVHSGAAFTKPSTKRNYRKQDIPNIRYQNKTHSKAGS